METNSQGEEPYRGRHSKRNLKHTKLADKGFFSRRREDKTHTLARLDAITNRRVKEMKGMKTLLAAAALTAAVVGTADAALMTIGEATYQGSRYKLIWDNDGPNGSVVWLDYSNPANTWENQVAWASGLESNLTVELKPGYSVTWTNSNWRLPSTVDGPFVYGYDGTTTAGYNITSSQFGHLYYTELGNQGYFDTSGIFQSGWGPNNVRSCHFLNARF